MSSPGFLTGVRSLIAKSVPPTFLERRPDAFTKFEQYLALLHRWNQRTNLTSIRSPSEIVTRHLIESIVCAEAISGPVTTLLDYGSGGGFPGVPIAICQPEVHVVLAESQNKKAAFLSEVVRSLGLNAEVYPHRAETIKRQFDWVAMRAVDRMKLAVPVALKLIVPGGTLALLTSEGEFEAIVDSLPKDMNWEAPVHLPNSERRLLCLGMKSRKAGMPGPDVPRGTS